MPLEQLAFLGTSKWRPEGRPEPTGGFMYLIWPGKAFGSGKHCQRGEGHLEYPAQPAVIATQPRIVEQNKWMAGGMDGYGSY